MSIVDELRDCAADIHTRECTAKHTLCTCGFASRCTDLLREAAARIEVALEALAEIIDDNKTSAVRRAEYALTTDRKAPFSTE
jgi:hypothetical protein